MSDDRSRKRKWDVHEPSNDNVKRVSMSPSQVKSSDTGKETLSEQEKALQHLRQQQQAQQKLLALLQLAKPASATALTSMSSNQQRSISDSKGPNDIRRRIYVGSLDYGVPESLIRDNFAVFGEITKLDYPREPSTGMTKGFCFIEFASEASAQSALKTMDGFVIAGRQVKVRQPQTSAAQLLRPPTATGQSGGSSSTSDANKVIYVGSIPYHVPEDKILSIFEPFGEIRNINMVPNPESSFHKGFGFVTYAEESSAIAAIKAMNGQSFHGRTIQVNYSNNCRPASTTSTEAESDITNPMMPTLGNLETETEGLSGLSGGPNAQAVPPSAPLDDPTSNIIVLQNLISVEDYQNEDPAEFEREIFDECALFGTVGRIVVLITRSTDNIVKQESTTVFSPSVDVYVSYMQKSAAIEAQKQLDQRAFGDSIVSASFVSNDQFQLVLETIAHRNR